MLTVKDLPSADHFLIPCPCAAPHPQHWQEVSTALPLEACPLGSVFKALQEFHFTHWSRSHGALSKQCLGIDPKTNPLSV